MDFATFSTLSNMFKLYLYNHFHTQGYLNYFDILSVGEYTQTYKIIQNYTSLIVKNDLMFQNLNKGIRIDSLIYLDRENITRRNLQFVKNTNKLSVDQLYLIYRHFNTLYSKNYDKKSFSLNSTEFEKVLKDDFFKHTNTLIKDSFEAFKKVSQDANEAFTKKDYYKFIFNILDLNNSTFIEIYELLILNKACNLFSALEKDDKGYIKNKSNKTSKIYKELVDYNDNNILTIDKSDIDYIIYVLYIYLQ